MGLACIVWIFPNDLVARPYSPGLPCHSIQTLIFTKGAVVLSTGPFTYDRFVRDQGYCVLGEITEPAWVITSDQRECFIGYTCGERQPHIN